MGTNGKISHGGVWNNNIIAQKIEDKALNLPPPPCLPYGIKKIPHVFVADDAFAL